MTFMDKVDSFLIKAEQGFRKTVNMKPVIWSAIVYGNKVYDECALNSLLGTKFGFEKAFIYQDNRTAETDFIFQKWWNIYDGFGTLLFWIK